MDVEFNVITYYVIYYITSFHFDFFFIYQDVTDSVLGRPYLTSLPLGMYVCVEDVGVGVCIYACAYAYPFMYVRIFMYTCMCACMYVCNVWFY